MSTRSCTRPEGSTPSATAPATGPGWPPWARAPASPASEPGSGVFRVPCPYLTSSVASSAMATPSRRDPFDLLVLDEAFVAAAITHEPSAAERVATRSRSALIAPAVTLGPVYRALVTALA